MRTGRAAGGGAVGARGRRSGHAAGGDAGALRRFTRVFSHRFRASRLAQRMGRSTSSDISSPVMVVTQLLHRACVGSKLSMTAALAAHALPVLPCALVEEPSGARPLQLPIDGTTRLMLHLAIDSISRALESHGPQVRIFLFEFRCTTNSTVAFRPGCYREHHSGITCAELTKGTRKGG